MYPASYYYYRRRLPGRSHKKALLIGFMVFSILLAGYGLMKLVNVKQALTNLPAFILGQEGENSLNIMYSAMPVLTNSGSIENRSAMPLAENIINHLSYAFRLDRHSPVALLEKELPVVVVEKDPPAVPAIKPEPVPSPPLDPEPEKTEQAQGPALSEECLVAIYNTHTGETYALTDGMERLQGKRGGVVQAAAALGKVLEEKSGIRVARSDAINDDVYKYSYANSEAVLKNLLEENPKIIAAFDIHRDAGKSREESIVKIDGQVFAPILIVVGSDARASFPGWQNNYQFAKKLAAEIDKKYPGLCLGVRVMDGRYNQFLHPRALLLEIGSVSNSTEEAVRSAQLLGEVLGPVIIEIEESSKNE